MQVKPDGPLSAKIAIVGEAPGVTEVMSGLGFSGMSGKLLWDILGRHGITRSDCYVTNVIKVRPPNDDLTTFIKIDKGHAKTTDAYELAEQALYAELATLSECNVIVAVGGVALWALCKKTAVSKRRGSILQGPLGKKVIPIIHPAAALREYMYTHMISLDAARIRQESFYPDIRLPARNIIIRPSFDDAINFLQKVKASPECSFDIETMRDEVSCISFSVSPSEGISIPFVSGGSDYFTLDQEIEIWKRIAYILADPGIIKKGQNLVFDTTFLFILYGIITNNIEDTMVGQAIAFPDYPKGLDFITSVYTREPYYKDEGKRWFKFGGDEKDFWLYNAKDSLVVDESWPKIHENLRLMRNLETYRTQRDLIPILAYMQTRGLRVDVEGLKTAQAEADAIIKAATADLKAMAGYDLNPDSPKQLCDFFYNRKGEKAYVNRKTGNPTTDEKALKRLARKGYEEANIILQIRHYSKLKGTYLDVTLDTDNRLRCAFNPAGTKNGRLSSSETIFGTGTNLQNLPEEFRKYVVADDNCMFFNVDLSQAENRIVAYIAPEPAMIAAFEKGLDVHSQTGALISGLPMEEVKLQDKEDVKCNLGGGLYTWRFWGKKANHGLNYDLGYKTFAFYYEISEQDAKYIVDRYHLAYPGIRQYHAWVRSKLSKERTLTNPLGRSRMFADRWGDELFKEAYNFIPQSTVADIINRWGLNYIYYNQDIFKPVDLLLQVHDSILFQMDYTKWSWAKQAEVLLALKNSLEKEIVWAGRSFVIPAEFMCGINFSKNSMKKVTITNETTVERLAEQLSGIYGKLRASV